jgi:hypothetical protein
VGETRLQRGRLVYGGEDSSTEGETLLRRGRLILFDGGTKLLKFVCCFISTVLLKVVGQWTTETGDIGWETKYIFKKNSHSCKYKRKGTEDKRCRNRGRETEEQRTGTVE